MALDKVTWLGFFMLLHPECRWYFAPDAGIHTISSVLTTVVFLIALVVVRLVVVVISAVVTVVVVVASVVVTVVVVVVVTVVVVVSSVALVIVSVASVVLLSEVDKVSPSHADGINTARFARAFDKSFSALSFGRTRRAATTMRAPSKLYSIGVVNSNRSSPSCTSTGVSNNDRRRNCATKCRKSS